MRYVRLNKEEKHKPEDLYKNSLNSVVRGHTCVWISPQSVTVSDPVTGEFAIRKNFSIHGGSDPGSVDLHKLELMQI